MRWAVVAILLWTAVASAGSIKRPGIKKAHAVLGSSNVTREPAPPIKVEPNVFTNDPVVGRGDRINGEGLTGLVAFTFDDGPNPETTPAVLDALKQYDIPTTFFIVTRRLVGKQGEKAREVLAREMAEGHMVESHSVTHANLKNAVGKQLDSEIDKSFAMLSSEAKRPIGMFRAPFGALGGAGRVRLRKLGVTEVFWSVDTLDWKAHNGERLRKKVLAMILKQKGGVVLMHDVKPITAKIVAQVFDDLEAENCRRLAVKEEPIWPVSLHYFLRDRKAPRAVPEDVARRTEAYRKALPERCAKRAAAATPTAPAATPPTAAAPAPAAPAPAPAASPAK